MKTLEEIKKVLLDHKRELIERFKIKTIGIFGSYVRGEEKKKSDVDILVEFESPIDFFLFLDLEEYIAELLGLKVDLVMKKALRPGIGKYILKEVEYV